MQYAQYFARVLPVKEIQRYQSAPVSLSRICDECGRSVTPGESAFLPPTGYRICPECLEEYLTTEKYRPAWVQTLIEKFGEL